VTWASDTPSVATVAGSGTNNITGTITAVAPGTAKITVTTTEGGKTASLTVNVAAPAVPAPVITSFTPAQAKHDETVTITGTNFGATAGANTVTFGGITAAIVTASATQLTVKVPKNLTALGAAPNSVQVTVAGKTATATERFAYVPTYVVSTLAGSGAAGFADGTGAVVQFNRPYGIAVDATGIVYVADTYNNRIRKITPGGVVTTLAGSGTQGFADGTGTVAIFNLPYGIAVEAAGNATVADTFNDRIRKISLGGVVSTLAGSSTQGFADGTGTATRFFYPQSVAVDTAGNTYVADTYNNRIRKITSAGVVTTLAGSGVASFADGTGIAALFNAPWSVAVDTTGNTYVADTRNHRIRKITPSGTVSTLAGDAQGFADGTGTAAQFSVPVGVAVDAAGNIYVVDEFNYRIRKITPSGVVSTLAGDGTAGSANGTGTAAQLHSQGGVAVDATGNLYVADSENHLIRKLTPE
jgi:hypothetical protein